MFPHCTVCQILNPKKPLQSFGAKAGHKGCVKIMSGSKQSWMIYREPEVSLMEKAVITVCALKFVS